MHSGDMENTDGVRLSWGTFPNTTAVAQKMSVPLGALYTPTKLVDNLGQIESKPVVCTSAKCRAVMNPFCVINYNTSTWTCGLCNQRNHLPVNYQGIPEGQLPPELNQQYTTLEYIVSKKPHSPAFVFVVDLVMIAEELEALKNSIRQALLLLPDDALVGLITFGSLVQIYELSFEALPKTYTFSSNQILSTKDAINTLGIQVHATNPGAAKSLSGHPQHPPQQQEQSGGVVIKGKERFLAPISECESHFNVILDDLLPEEPLHSDYRPTRAFGPAVTLALDVLDATHFDMNARVLSFLAGVPVQSPGMVASRSFADTLRTHKDIQKGDNKLYDEATRFYSHLASRAAGGAHIIDLFACCLDQVGVAEMHSLVTQTGGELILDDSFTRGAFQGSIKRLLTPELVYDEQGEVTQSDTLQMAFNARLMVTTTANIRITSAHGHYSIADSISHEQLQEYEAPPMWRLGGLMPDSTFALFFSPNAKNKAGAGLNHAVVQFVTHYSNSGGTRFCRVSTIKLRVSDDINELRSAFDQEASAVLMTRYAIHKCVLDPGADVRRWLDRILIKLCAQFGFYTENDPNSFKLTNDFALYPQFMFYLRRSQIIQIFNSSPDETVFFRTICLKQNTQNTLTMIQPRLIAYSTNGPPEPVLLDTSQLHPTRILLLDTFFHVVVWYGATISHWKSSNLHMDPQYAYLGPLFKAPLVEAKRRIESRLPTPRFIECVEGHSQARFVLSKLNPSTGATLSSTDDEQIVFSDDVNLQMFTFHLKKLVVKQPKS